MGAEPGPRDGSLGVLPTGPLLRRKTVTASSSRRLPAALPVTVTLTVTLTVAMSVGVVVLRVTLAVTVPGVVSMGVGGREQRVGVGVMTAPYGRSLSLTPPLLKQETAQGSAVTEIPRPLPGPLPRRSCPCPLLPAPHERWSAGAPCASSMLCCLSKSSSGSCSSPDETEG